MGTDEIDEMGPVDYLLVEWPGRQPHGEVAPYLIDLVDRGLIRVLDIAVIAKGEDGSVARVEISDVGGEVEEFAAFDGASSGLLSDEDTSEAGSALEPGTSAALRSSPLSMQSRRRPREGGVTMPGLIRGVARTAVIAGTATSVSNRVSRRQGQRWQAQEEQSQQAAPAPPAPAQPEKSAVDQLKELGELKQQGILTEEEFAAQKAKILGA
jgi:hypothetical protein